uniref:Uncharacterized protein n=1 Tax=Cliftonaea pectinata TaxID=2007206 RepID=A0A1Z1MQN5_9FLOR|nr:hypothetical protein [Cliftonaea pectinata]ARW68189.1 hypothetical protein [Cliftonaea pectinata]
MNLLVYLFIPSIILFYVIYFNFSIIFIYIFLRK